MVLQVNDLCVIGGIIGRTVPKRSNRAICKLAVDRKLAAGT
jgi:hypothetical protein